MSAMHPTCPRCRREARWLWAEQRCLGCGWGDAVARPKHRARALAALAAELCATDLTDGFCAPRDGECRNLAGGRTCIARAEGLVKAMESVGVKVVWVFDPERGA